MKIGILTFHWATNYGAILQAWCLQEYLTEIGHEVAIINYKPTQFDFSWFKIIKHPGLLKTLKKQIINRKKESLLSPFREEHLAMTRRFGSVSEFGSQIDHYDILISGSDQVLNPGFTTTGDNGNPSPAYWLGVGRKELRRLGYAVSFGCEKYPDDAAYFAKQWVNNFDTIATRERTGLQVLDSLTYKGPKIVVPDPTLLLGNRIFEKLDVSIPSQKSNYICVYMLRREIKLEEQVRYIDETHHPLTMEQWITTITQASGLITNSYHGTLMAIYAHVPFVVLLETGQGKGMNDRFYTMLEQLGCTDRVTDNTDKAMELLAKPIDFEKLDNAIVRYRKIGEDFLINNISRNI